MKKIIAFLKANIVGIFTSIIISIGVWFITGLNLVILMVCFALFYLLFDALVGKFFKKLHVTVKPKEKLESKKINLEENPSFYTKK